MKARDATGDSGAATGRLVAMAASAADREVRKGRGPADPVLAVPAEIAGPAVATAVPVVRIRD
jgi:hypothetical protein